MADPVSREPRLPDEARQSAGFPRGSGDTATAPTPVSRAGVQGNRRRCRRRPLRARSAADAGSGFVRARLIVRRTHVTETERALPSLQSRLESTGKRTRRLLERRQAPGTGRRTPVFLPSCRHRVARHLLPFALRRIKLNTLSSKLPPSSLSPIPFTHRYLVLVSSAFLGFTLELHPTTPTYPVNQNLNHSLPRVPYFLGR